MDLVSRSSAGDEMDFDFEVFPRFEESGMSCVWNNPSGCVSIITMQLRLQTHISGSLTPLSW
jgi:hypothetical protein